MFRTALLCALVAVAFSGCVTVHSREPLYDRTRESTFNKAFAGTWFNDEMRFRIEPGDPDGAVVVFECQGEDNQRTSESFPADLVLIGSWRYMFPRSPGADAAATANPLPWLRFRRQWNQLAISALNHNELARRLETGKPGFIYEWQERQVLDSKGLPRSYKGAVTINAPARDIRRYLEKHENDRALFLEAQRMTRE